MWAVNTGFLPGRISNGKGFSKRGNDGLLIAGFLTLRLRSGFKPSLCGVAVEL
jgi:hypothetical protein